jgi:hypothetical protein
MSEQEQEAYQELQKIESEVEDIIKIVDPKDVPFLEMFYSIINANFHYMYNIWKSWYNHFDCSSCGKED